MLRTRVAPAPHPAVRVVHPVVIGVLLSLLVAPASAQQSRNVTLLSHMNAHPDATDPEPYRACWSYVHSDGREYAVILTSKGASFVRLTDPTNPAEVGFINAPTGRAWLEAKQYQHWVFLTTEFVKDYATSANDTGIALIDMSDPDHPQKVGSFQSPENNAHTLTIDQARSLLYLNGVVLNCTGNVVNCALAMRIYSIVDPVNPVLVGSYPEYVHDIHLRGNRGYASLIGTPDNLFGSGGTLAILDLTNPAQPTEITRIHTPRTVQHSSWTTDDGRFLYAANEVGGVGLTAWDIHDLSSIRQVWGFEGLPDNIVHQPHVLGNTLSVSYYTAGVRLFDLSGGVAQELEQ